MTMRRTRNGLRASACAAAMLATAFAIPATAEAGISSWFWSSEKTETDKPAATKGEGSPEKNQEKLGGPDAEAQPGTIPGTIPGAVAPARQGTGALQAAPATTYTGEDAAYRALEDGKYLTALEIAKKKAGENHPASHTLIGRIYSEGLGVAKDEKAAADWYTRGAQLGDVNAAFALGLMHAQGRGGIDKNFDKAAELFETAARTGHPQANYNLGLLFLNGTGKPLNEHRAARHIAYAAEKGIAAAQYDLAGLYGAGSGVTFDAYEQARWLAKAADQGLATAEYEYAVLLLQGKGIRADEPKAIPYLKSAAAKGVAGAQNRLAWIYDEGIGVAKDAVEMAKWRILARDGGVEDMLMDNKVAALTEEERTQAMAAASRFRDKSLTDPLAIR